jgi:hypothetical protein
MADHRNYLLLAAVGALLAACQAGSPSQVETVAEGVRQYGQIGFQPCTLTATQAAGNVEALCGKWKVAENRLAGTR